MGGNTFGRVFRITTFGESHGSGIGVVIDGCPPGMELDCKDFEPAMMRRRPGSNEVSTPRKEPDAVEILSGVFEGRTTGTPIALFIRNQDVDSRPYEVLKDVFRPGHGDYTYFKKYGHFDYRGGGRSSARETAARVAAGVVAEKILCSNNIEVLAYTVELGGIKAKEMDLENVNKDPLLCPDAKASVHMVELMKKIRKQGDSVGGIIEAKVMGCPPGLGEPVFDKLEADLAKALFSIGAVKGVEVGEGFSSAALKGSENNDAITATGFKTNHAGGILGGISNGEDIILRVAVKPIPSIALEQDTIDRQGNPRKLKLRGRHDVCAIPRIIPVIEAMIRIVLADHYLRNLALCGGYNRNTGV